MERASNNNMGTEIQCSIRKSGPPDSAYSIGDPGKEPAELDLSGIANRASLLPSGHLGLPAESLIHRKTHAIATHRPSIGGYDGGGSRRLPCPSGATGNFDSESGRWFGWLLGQLW